MTQKDMILEHLMTGAELTQLDAYDLFGCTRLAAQICRLRREGHAIHKENVLSKNRYGKPVTFARYWMEVDT